MPDNSLKPVPVWALSLGCPKNRVDTEKLLGSVAFPVERCESIAGSGLALINTCAFIEPATRESIRAVLDVIEELKKSDPRPLLAVAGCMVGRYGIKELARELPEVDLWLATQEMESWPRMLNGAMGINAVSAKGRLLSTGPAYAWLKISEGCRHKCSFCAIPAIRGRLRSEKAGDIIAEASSLLASGVKELNLVAQDITAWGSDFADRHQPGPVAGHADPRNLPELLRALAILPGLAWLRLLYLYPDSLTDELLKTMAEIGKPVLPYLDIPLQHVEPEILSRMGRPFTADPRATIERVRKYLPDAAIRTTFIVGFPGESEGHFQALLRFVEEAGFRHMGVFAYQPEDGTKAALMPDQVPEEVKELRKEELMALQADISRASLENYIGQRMAVLVERPQGEWPGLHVGRVWFQAPEVDGITYVSGPGVIPGALVECDIENSHAYDLDALASI